MKLLRSLAFACFAVLLLAPPGRADDAVVNTLTDEFDDPSGAQVSLREAIRDVGNSGGTITFKPSLNGGVIKLKGVGETNGGALIKERKTVNMVIDALSLPDGITVDGQKGTSFFRSDPSDASVLTLRGLTFKDGKAIGLADAPLLMSDTSLTVERCTFSGNQGNELGLGGAIYFNGTGGGTLVVRDCTFVDNGMGNPGSNGGGGAIQIDGSAFSSVTVTNSTFTKNVVGIGKGSSNVLGGAILIRGYSGTFTMSHCTIFGNSAVEGGGGLAVIESPFATVIMENCIIAGNKSVFDGADVIVKNFVNPATPPKLTLRGVSIVGNLSLPLTGEVTDGNGLVLKIAKPKLAALGQYGGRTQTMALLPGSPAIDAAPDPQSGLTDDQTGGPRRRGPRCDIGAVEFSPFASNGLGVEVTTTADELDPPGVPGAGLSLREALRDGPNGATIKIAREAFFNVPPIITLNPALGPLRPRPGVTYVIDGSAFDFSNGVEAPVTIDGGGQTQVLQVDPGVTLNLRRFTFTGGNGQQSNVGNFVGGGGIVNGGNLTLVECSVEGNTSLTRGGGIENNRTLLAQRCSFLNNTANTGEPDAETGGGAVANLGKATFENCTFSGNTAAYGGAIDQGFISGAAFPDLSLSHCTISGNTSNAVGIPPDDPPGPLDDSGGGIYSFFDWTLRDSIVAGNTPNDVTNTDDGGFQREGIKIAESIVPAFLNVRGGKKDGVVTTSDPKLGSLGSYGGPTQTIPLLDGSPAINAANVELPTDQRGFGINGKPDIGAFEAGAFSPGSFKVQIADNTSPALPERAAPAGAPIVITSGESELTLDVKSDGSFKGTLVFLSGKYTFTGQLAEDRTASIPLTGRNLPPLTLDITITGANDENIDVTVTGATFAGIGNGTELVPARRYTAPPELVGRYTAVVVGDSTSTGEPVLGVLAFEITKTGAVRLIGSLNDGTKFAFGSRIAGDSASNAVITGRIPLYKKKGFMTLEISPGVDVAGVSNILRPPGTTPATPASLAGGFEHSSAEVIVRRYLPPPKGAPLVPGFSDNPMGMHADLKTGPNASDPRLMAYDFTLPPTGKSTSAVPGFQLKVVPKLGVFLGTHPNPTVGARPPMLPFFGVLMQNYAASAGYGLSKDANVPYWLELRPGPAVP